jgi:hypothetical protein
VAALGIVRSPVAILREIPDGNMRPQSTMYGSTRLSSSINGTVDFVKIDIGAVTLEYHQNPGNLAERRLEQIYRDPS